MWFNGVMETTPKMSYYGNRHATGRLQTAWNGYGNGEILWDETSDLPELTGTEKQIKWADDLRRKAIGLASDDVRAHRSRGIASGLDPAVVDQQIAPVVEALHKIAAHGEASWWIDNRHRTSTEMLRIEAEL
jgi:hypothetical protein